MTDDSGVLYVYRCPECGHRGEQHHADDSHDGAASTCSACGAAVTLEWDGGVDFRVREK
ncbi:zinc ribbon domain-containing protein [Burkholderia cenocepacia]|nr:zinc ribbon domain-containing protein [Burkholderia cenocepacia]